MAKVKSHNLTIPDLVLLSLLGERPMHGYEANQELERRQVRDWAGVSRPQVYYSLEKLARIKLARVTDDEGSSAGPERRIFETTAAGKKALADALEKEDWATQRDRPRFLTWIALSWQARPGVFQKHIQRRREFLETELENEQATLQAIRKEVGHEFHEAIWMVSLTIDMFKVELRWLEKLSKELANRKAAMHPDYFGESDKN